MPSARRRQSGGGSKRVGTSGSALLGLARKCLSLPGPGKARFPPGLGWFRWGRGSQSPVPWLGPGRAASRRRSVLQRRGQVPRALVPMATPRAARSVLRRERKRGCGRRQGSPFLPSTRPSLRVSPARRRPWYSPRRKRLWDGTGSREQLWLRASPVRLSPAAPPPSPETGWSSVSSGAPGPTSKPPQSRRAAASEPRSRSRPLSLPRALGFSSSRQGPQAPRVPLRPGPGVQAPLLSSPSSHIHCLSARPARCCFSSSFFCKVGLIAAPPSSRVVRAALR